MEEALENVIYWFVFTSLAYLFLDGLQDSR